VTRLEDLRRRAAASAEEESKSRKQVELARTEAAELRSELQKARGELDELHSGECFYMKSRYERTCTVCVDVVCDCKSRQ
jgi:hypothetical protein